MKILVIELDRAAPEPLFGLPGLHNIRRLMDAGCYGRLESIVPPVAVPASTWLCDQVADATAKEVEVVRHCFATADWEYLDEQIGGLLETLDEDFAVLVLADHDGCNRGEGGAFILAAPNCPLSGEIEGVHLVDLAPTLLALGGYDVPPSMQGRSLVSGGVAGVLEPALSFSDEELVRQRLSGLGYI
jgi:predicted AlkP superfamily phosphohydrolase/phosphomutase